MSQGNGNWAFIKEKLSNKSVTIPLNELFNYVDGIRSEVDFANFKPSNNFCIVKGGKNVRVAAFAVAGNSNLHFQYVLLSLF